MRHHRENHFLTPMMMLKLMFFEDHLFYNQNLKFLKSHNSVSLVSHKFHMQWKRSTTPVNMTNLKYDLAMGEPFTAGQQRH